jgi:hypothetical protein
MRTFGGDLGQGAWGAGTIIAEIDNRNFIRRILANGSERRGIIVHGNLHGYGPSAARLAVPSSLRVRTAWVRHQTYRIGKDI